MLKLHTPIFLTKPCLPSFPSHPSFVYWHWRKLHSRFQRLGRGPIQVGSVSQKERSVAKLGNELDANPNTSPKSLLRHMRLHARRGYVFHSFDVIHRSSRVTMPSEIALAIPSPTSFSAVVASLIEMPISDFNGIVHCVGTSTLELKTPCHSWHSIARTKGTHRHGLYNPGTVS